MDTVYIYWTLTISWAKSGLEYKTIPYTTVEECFYKASFFETVDIDNVFDYMCSFAPIIGVVI